MKIIVLLGIVFLSLTNSVFLSGQEIAGRVTDLNGNPLAGAALTIKNTNTGNYSGQDGSFLLKVPANGKYTLVASFIGYSAFSQDVGVSGRIFVEVKLKPELIVTDEVIVNGTRAGNKTPVTFTNVSSDIIKRSNSGIDMPFLISLTPSLVETSETGTGIGYTGLRIRGTDGSRINVTLDGIPMNDAESQQVFWVDLPDLASSVDNIQVQRGVGTSSNGSGAFGASINIETKNPDSQPFAEINSTAGSFGTFNNSLSAGTGLLSGKYAFQMRLSDIKSDGYIERTGVRNRSAFLSGVYISGRSRLKANLILGEEHTGISWWGVPKEMLAKDRRYNPAGEYTDSSGVIQHYDNESDNYKQNHFQLIYSLNLNKYLYLNTAFHYTFGKGYYEEYREDQAFSDYGLNPVVAGSSQITSTDLIRRKWLSNDFYGLVYTIGYKKGRIDAKLGGGINSYIGDNYGTIIWMRSAGKTEKDYQWYLNSSTKNEFNIYGKLNYNLTDKINAFGDLNYRYIFYKMKGPDDDLRILNELHDYNFFNPKVGLFFTPAANQDAYVSFAVAHKEPTRSDYKEAAGDNAATPKPEALYDIEAGYNLRINKFALGVNLFGMYYKDQLIPTGELSSVGYPIMTNVDRSYRAGTELTADIKPATILDWKLNMTLSVNKIQDFTEYYSDYISASNSYEYKSKNLGSVDLAYSPSFISSSEIVLNFPKQIKFHLITKYVGRQYFDNTMSSDRRLDAYLVNSLRIDCSIPVRGIKNVDLQLFINNLLNSKYENNAYGGTWYEDGKENTWSYYFPQAGISFMAKLSLRF
jgi:iron complex outermembrane recepter protein